MYKVRDMMTSPVNTISLGASVSQAADFMKKNNLGGLPVVEDNKLVGIITSRDVRINHPNRIVADAMTKPVICCSPNSTTWDAAALMDEYKIERLPVVEQDKVVGIITEVQMVKHISRLYDPLTETFNSEYIYQVAFNLLELGHKISVILLDVDDFGEMNKRWGHVYGDKCLKKIASVLKSVTNSKNDFFCRYGGDEFVIVTLRNSEEAMVMAKEVLDKISKIKLEYDLSITVSAGISEFREKIHKTEGDYYDATQCLINEASLASTKAKRHKTRICFNIGA